MAAEQKIEATRAAAHVGRARTGQGEEERGSDETRCLQRAVRSRSKPFARIHTGHAVVNQDADNQTLFGNIQNGVDIRRARARCVRRSWEVLAYRFDVDFVTKDPNTLERPTIFDAYLDVQKLPLLGTVRVGQFREPFSLERLDSTNDLPFLERSLAVNTFAPFRNMGVMAFNVNEEKTATFALGGFREASNEFGEDIGDGDGTAVTTRGTWLAYYDEPAQGRYLTHFGASTASVIRTIKCAASRKFPRRCCVRG